MINIFSKIFKFKDNKNHYFNIIQSNILDIKLDYIVDKLKKHIQ